MFALLADARLCWLSATSLGVPAAPPKVYRPNLLFVRKRELPGCIRFIGRQQDLAVLEREFEALRASLIILYGSTLIRVHRKRNLPFHQGERILVHPGQQEVVLVTRLCIRQLPIRVRSQHPRI